MTREEAIRLAEQAAAKARPATVTIGWSAVDKKHVATCAEYPSLSWLASSGEKAADGLFKIIACVLVDQQPWIVDAILEAARRGACGYAARSDSGGLCEFPGCTDLADGCYGPQAIWKCFAHSLKELP